MNGHDLLLSREVRACIAINLYVVTGLGSQTRTPTRLTSPRYDQFLSPRIPLSSGFKTGADVGVDGLCDQVAGPVEAILLQSDLKISVKVRIEP